MATVGMVTEATEGAGNMDRERIGDRVCTIAAMVGGVAGAVVGSIGFLSDGGHGELADFCGELFPAMVSLDAVNRIPLWPYQSRVAACRDVACLLMVSRC